MALPPTSELQRRRNLVRRCSLALMKVVDDLGHEAGLYGEAAFVGLTSQYPQRRKVHTLVKLRQGYHPSTVEAVVPLFPQKNSSFQIVGGSLVFVDSGQEYAGVKDKICAVQLQDHRAFFTSSDTPRYQQIAGELKLAPLLVILLHSLERWAISSNLAKPTARRRAEQLLVGYLSHFPVLEGSLPVDKSIMKTSKVTRLEDLRKNFSQQTTDQTVIAFMDRLAPRENQRLAIKPRSPPTSARTPTSSSSRASTSRSAPTSIISSLSSLRLDDKERIEYKRPAPIVAEAARAAVRILKANGFSAAIVGSLASWLYGATRTPNDVDILVLPPQHITRPDQEAIKRQLVAADSRFFLKNSINPLATYKVLHYRLYSFLQRTSKVDLLLPGVMNLPALPPDQIVTIDDLPVAPFSLLLITKLQCWDDHRKAAEDFKRDKQYTDIIDIETLLGLKHIEGVRREKPWKSTELFSPVLQTLTAQRVKDICRTSSQQRKDWEKLGFSV